MAKTAILIGNSDGIGLAMTRRLLTAGWKVVGLSRSDSPISSPNYHHRIADVGDAQYPDILRELILDRPVDLCIYLAGIGDPLNTQDMSREARIIDVNLTGMVRTASVVIPPMVKAGAGHFIGISSVADELLSAEAPSYFASKAGFSNYLGGLALALRPKGVSVTNVRFGFVDTKMAKSSFRPFMMSTEKAADILESCIRRKPACHTSPKVLIPFIKLLKLAHML